MSDPFARSAMGGAAEVLIYADAAQLARAAAELFAAAARRAVSQSGRFSVALSGGSTPEATYRLLARPPFLEDVPWRHVHVFWGDERCVDAGDQRSNERMGRETLLDHIAVPARQVHPMRCADEAGCPEAAARYERLLREWSGSAAPAPAGLDLVLLGLGDDGHTASLFPGSPVLSEREHWVACAWGGGLPRLTLTAGFINLARLAVFVVAGAEKAPAVKRVLEGTDAADVALPARLIQPAGGRLVWLMERQAAALLTAALRDRGVAQAASAACATPQEGPL